MRIGCCAVSRLRHVHHLLALVQQFCFFRCGILEDFFFTWAQHLLLSLSQDLIIHRTVASCPRCCRERLLRSGLLNPSRTRQCLKKLLR